MLLRFRFSNYRSFKDEAELSLVATPRDVDVARPAVVSQATHDTVGVLPIIAILGANASGKSNLLRAMGQMRHMVLSSFSTTDRLEGLVRDPFLLHPEWMKRSTLFELDFVVDQERYQYGFEIDDSVVLGEWLHFFPHKRTQTLFDRERQDFQFGRALTGQNRAASEITRPNSLFLTSAALSGHPRLRRVYDWFSENLITVSRQGRIEAAERTLRRLAERKSRVESLIAMADLGIAGTRLVKREVDEARLIAIRKAVERHLPQDAPDREQQIAAMLEQFMDDQRVLELMHKGTQGSRPLSFEQESDGTKTWLTLVVATLEALDDGGSLIIDELDSSLHPLLMAEILRLFEDRRSNRHNAQLIFTTHDTNTLGSMTGNHPLSRGQIWFVDKGPTGASKLTPLTDYRPRKGENIERGYIQGRYGGTPIVQSDRMVEAAARQK